MSESLKNINYIDHLLSLFSPESQTVMKEFAYHHKKCLDTEIVAYVCYYFNLFPGDVTDSIEYNLLCHGISGYNKYTEWRQRYLHGSNETLDTSKVVLSDECVIFVERLISFAKNPFVVDSTNKNDLYLSYMAYEFLNNQTYKIHSLLKLCINSRQHRTLVSRLQKNLYEALRIPNDPEILKYGKVLTDPLVEFESCVARDFEIQNIVNILGRKKKNNPILVGPPGVGKTAIIEGLASYIMSSECPDYLRGYHIISISVSSILAGTKYRGDYEERLEKIVKIVLESSDSIILFIDEIHTLLTGSKSSSEGMAASDIFKPYLSRTGFCIIGATTPEEYKLIESDKALNRRFSVVEIHEPSDADTRTILSTCISSYSNYHNVTIPTEIIDKVVSYARTYIPNRYMPDKAFDLLDTACVHCSRYNSSKIVSDDDLLSALKILTNTDIPVIGMTESANKLKELPNVISKSIIGQNEAIQSVYNQLRKYFMGFIPTNKPIGSFLFVGPTGVGKTQLCKDLAAHLFTPESFVRIDMSEYMEKHSVSKLIGSPPGYVGYSEGGKLIEIVKHNPHSVILFDEIEKAHPDVFNILLQILDDGILTDSSGYTAHFNNSLIIITSNIGASEVSEKRNNSIGFNSVITDSDIKNLYNKSIKHYFKPEFLNRLDKIVYFNSLDFSDIRKIVDMELNKLQDTFSKIGVTVILSDSALDSLYHKCFNPEYGARFANRIVHSNVEDIVLDYILENDLLNKVPLSIRISESSGMFHCDLVKEIRI